MEAYMRVNFKKKVYFIITAKLEEYTIKALEKLNPLFKDNNFEANVLFREDSVNKIAEITIPTKHLILRGESRAASIIEAIDSAIDKLESQIKRHKDKIYSAYRKRQGVSKYYSETVELDLDKMMVNEVDTKVKLMKEKTIELNPMTIDEAIVQMENLGHDFFVFLNSENQKVSVVYIREDYTYGVIATK